MPKPSSIKMVQEAVEFIIREHGYAVMDLTITVVEKGGDGKLAWRIGATLERDEHAAAVARRGLVSGEAY